MLTVYVIVFQQRCPEYSIRNVMIIIFIMLMIMTKYEYDYNFDKFITSIVTNVINVAEGNSDQILQIFCPITFLHLLGCAFY